MQAVLHLLVVICLLILSRQPFGSRDFFFTSKFYDMNQSVVRIAVSSAANYSHIDDVVYYRSGMTPDFVTRWRWYFDLLAALVKVANPRRRVEVWYGPVDIMLGDEWHQYRRQAMLKSRRIKLKQLQHCTPSDDLFGFGIADHEKRISTVLEQIELLERDEYPIPQFPVYINNIKDYIRECE